MKKCLLLISISLLSTIQGFAQKPIYHVTSSSLVLRVEANKDSKKLQTLNQYDNVKVLELGEGEWSKVDFNGKVGYVAKKFIKEGKAVVSYTRYRVGATCKDGTSSSATGRGACSHHGGVRSWRYGQKKSVSIKKK